MSFWGLIILGAVGGFIWNLKDWSKLKRIVCIVVAYIVCALIFNSGGFSESAIEKSVAACLRNETNYQNIHIIDVDKVNEEDDYVTYKWKAEFKFQGALCRESGFVYYYKNGDLKDFRRMNDLDVVR